MKDIRIAVFENDNERKIKDRTHKQLSDRFPGIQKEVEERVSEEIIEFARDNNFIRKKNKDEEGGLRFVGTYTLRINVGDNEEFRLMVYVLPKYLKKTEEAVNNPEIYMNPIRRVIEKTDHLFDYDKLEAEFNPFEFNREQARVSRYDMAKWLLNDYERNGIFTVREKRHTRDRRGRIAWNRTILKTMPVVDGDDVAYINPISTYISRNDRLLLSDIHRCVMKEVIDDLDEEAKDVTVPLFKEELLGHLSEYALEIKNFQRLVFVERDIILLRYLEAWCLEQSNYYEKPKGTVSFDLVWEDVLRGVFGHKNLDKKVGFGAPIYHIDGIGYELSGDSIPDALNFWPDTQGPRFLVLDGKHYLGEIYGRRKIKSLPGYKDVAKQIDYFDTLIKIYGLKPKNGKNVFVMPRWDELCIKKWEKTENLGFKKASVLSVPLRYVGYVSKPGKQDIIMRIIDSESKISDDDDDDINRDGKYDYVHIVQIQPEELYSLYLEGDFNSEKNAQCLWDFLDREASESQVNNGNV